MINWLKNKFKILQDWNKCFQKLGVAFCMGFVKEAEILASILKRHNFSVESVVCKVGGIDKAHQGIENGQRKSRWRSCRADGWPWKR